MPRLVVVLGGACALTLALAGGCSSPRLGSAPPAPPATPAAVAYPQAAHILAGFDHPTDDPGWHVGDQLLYAVTFERDGARQTRFVRLMLKTGAVPPDTRVVVVPTTPDATAAAAESGPAPRPDSQAGELAVTHPQPPGTEARTMRMVAYESRSTVRRAGGDTVRLARYSRPVLVAVDVYDEAGQLEASSFVAAPELVLRTGMYDGTRLFRDLQARFGDAVAHDAALDDRYGVLSHAHDLAAALEALQRTLSACDSLRPLLLGLAPRPSFLSLLRHGGIKSQLALVLSEFADARDAPRPAGIAGRPLNLPLVITFNKETAVRCDLAIVPPRPPLHLTAGVVVLEAWLPQSPDRRVRAELLAARRGREPTEAPGR